MAGGSLGTVFYDVMPDMAKFASGVAAGLGRAKPIKIAVEADTSKLAKQIGATSKVRPIKIGVEADTAKLASGIKKASTVRTIKIGVEADQGKLTSSIAKGTSAVKPQKIAVEADTGKAQARIQQLVGSTSKLTTEERHLESAQSTLRVATARLAETQATAAAGSARLISAEESAAKAARSVKFAQDQVAISTARLAAEQAAAAASADKSASAFSRLGGRLKEVDPKSIGRGFAIAGAAIGVGLLAAVKVTADFDKAVSGVEAAANDGGKSISRLREEAIKYGAATAFSATEAANAQTELIKANVSVTNTINGGLKGALDLAAAGSLGVADAAGIMGTAMSQFEIPGTQASHVADLLSAAAGKAQGEVGDFAEALKYVGPVAHSAGVSIDETVGVLAEFANQGVLGSQAGTSFRGILTSLTAPSKIGAEEMRKYGINVRDASGEFIGMSGAAGALQKGLQDVSQAERDAALSRIFGRNSLVAATILYNGGAEEVNKWTGAVDDSGFAARTAATQMDNLSGDIEKFTGSVSSAAIGLTESATSPLRGIVQAGTGIVDIFNGWSDGAKKAAFGIAAVTGASLLAGAALLKLGVGLRTATLAAGPIGIALGVATAVVAHFAIKNMEARDRANDLAGTLDQTTASVTAGTRAFAADALAKNGAIQAATKLGISQDTLVSAYLGNADAIAVVNAGMDGYQSKVDGVRNTRLSPQLQAEGNQWGFLQEQIGLGNAALGTAQGQVSAVAAETQKLTDANGDLSETGKTTISAILTTGAAFDAMGKKSKLTSDEIDAVTQSLFAVANASLGMSDAAIGYEAALDNMTKSVKENGRNTDIGTEKGRANRTALNQQAVAAQALDASYLKSGKSASFVADKVAAQRSAFIASARAMGYSAPKARELADSLGLIPKKVESEVKAKIDASNQKKIDDLRNSLQKLPPEVATEIRTALNRGDVKGAEAIFQRYQKSVTKKINVSKGDGFANVTTSLDRFGRPVKASVSVRSTGVKPTAAAINQISKTKRNALIYVNQKGQQLTQRQINRTKGKGVYIAVDQKGQPLTQRKINSTKGVSRYVLVNQKGQPATQRQINSTHGKGVTISVTASGLGSIQTRINQLHGKTVVIKQRTVKSGNKTAGEMSTGGPVTSLYPRYASGSSAIRGVGGPRQDNIAGIDRATGLQTSWVSVGEAVVKETAYRANRQIVDDMNAGKRFRRLADGGSVVPTKAKDPGANRTTVIVNVDLGPELGGIRRIVADEIDQHGEFVASLDGMR